MNANQPKNNPLATSVTPLTIKPEEKDIASREYLMADLVNFFKATNASISEIAKICQITYHRATDLMLQKSDMFTADELQKMVTMAIPIISSKRLLRHIKDIFELNSHFTNNNNPGTKNHGLMEGFLKGEKEGLIFFITGVFKDGGKERFFFDLDPGDYTTPHKAQWGSFIKNDVTLLERYDESFLSPADIFKYIPLLHEAFPGRVIDKHVFDPSTKLISTYEGYLAPVWS